MTNETFETLERMIRVAHWLAYIFPAEGAEELAQFQRQVAETMIVTIEELLQQFPQDERVEHWNDSTPRSIAGGRLGTASALLTQYLLSDRNTLLSQVGSELSVSAMYIGDMINRSHDHLIGTTRADMKASMQFAGRQAEVDCSEFLHQYQDIIWKLILGIS